jgi:hypothetical protein
MRGIILLSILLLSACAPKQAYTPRHYEPIEYHATPYVTEVEWDIDFGGTAQMAFYCEIIYITVQRGDSGDVKLIVKSNKE